MQMLTDWTQECMIGIVYSDESEATAFLKMVNNKKAAIGKKAHFMVFESSSIAPTDYKSARSIYLRHTVRNHKGTKLSIHNTFICHIQLRSQISVRCEFGLCGTGELHV